MLTGCTVYEHTLMYVEPLIKAELSIVIDFMMLLFHYKWAIHLRKPFVDEKKHGSIRKQKLIIKLLIC